jgi:putative IMPACT (imprinted ancient) family translation regulator
MTAALRAADLGAKTVLVTRDEFGGMAANDGPVPVRTLAHAARLDYAMHDNSIVTASLSASRGLTTRGCWRAYGKWLKTCERTRPSARSLTPRREC